MESWRIAAKEVTNEPPPALALRDDRRRVLARARHGALGGAGLGTIKETGSKAAPRTPTIAAGPTSPTTFDAVIRNNVVRDSGFDPRAKGWIDGSGILVNSSPNVEIYANMVENNRHGIGATNTDRGTSTVYGVREVRNLRVHDNVIQVPSGTERRAAGVVGTIIQPFSDQARYDRNAYRVCSQTEFVGPKPAGSTSYGYISWADWRGPGQDADSTLTSGC